jgi:hypothetical protein
MRFTKKLLSFVALLAIIATPILIIVNLQAIEDWWKLRDYTPPAAVAKLTEEDTMTQKAQHLFYINHPQLIADKMAFRKACPQAEQTIVLGCYHPVENGIAVYDITDARLNGVKEVTSAHEMLHAAYDRLSSKDKSYVNGLLQNYYNNDVKNQRIIDIINAYKKAEPNDVVNEMHSIFGTEVASLPAPLETYYKQYFSNRQAVISLSNQYQSVFTQNQQQLTSIKNQIEILKTQLESLKQQITDQEAEIQSESQRLQELRNSNRIDEYNASVAPYNAKVNALRSLIAQFNAKVVRVNQLVEQYNALAVAQEGLYQSLDTSAQPKSAQ